NDLFTKAGRDSQRRSLDKPGKPGTWLFLECPSRPEARCVMTGTPGGMHHDPPSGKQGWYCGLGKGVPDMPARLPSPARHLFVVISSGLALTASVSPARADTLLPAFASDQHHRSGHSSPILFSSGSPKDRAQEQQHSTAILAMILVMPAGTQ